MKRKVEQKAEDLRRDSYPQNGDQLDALYKIVSAILPHLSAKARAAIPSDALAVLGEIDQVKRRFPKKNPAS